MKNNFSFRRIGLMLKADCMEYKKSFLLFAVLLLAANMFLFRETANGIQTFIFSATMFGTLMFFYTFVGWKVHRSKNRFLTLPSGAIEKFVEILIVGLIFFGVCKLVHVMVLGCSHFIYGTQLWFMRDMIIDSNMGATLFTQLKMAIGIFSFIFTFFFMCCIAFRKYALPFGALILILYGIICVYTVYLFAKIEDFNTINYMDGLIRSNAMIETVLFLSANSALGLSIASVVMLYISYLKLKEKQIR